MTTQFAFELSHQNNELHGKAVQMREYLEQSGHEELVLMARALGIPSARLDDATLRSRLLAPLVTPSSMTRPEH
ncbi:MAG: hypothetical protein R3E68_14340 [Burkholderiaceae bacterium]